MFDRIIAALLTAAPTALLLCAATSLWLGRRLELLPGNQGLGPWLFIVLWLLLTTLTAQAKQPVSVWRRGLYGNAAGSATVALSGLLLHAPQAGAVAAACAIATLACSAGAMLLPRASAASARAPTRARRTGLLRRCMNGLPWWVLATCFVESFRIAQTSGDGRGAGHTGMLIAFFVLLPALSVVRWFRGPALFVWLIGGALLGWLGIEADRPILAVLALMALLCALPLGGRALPAAGAVT
ncbi:hypothetical protein [Methyloversatilis sp.]|uniref:hypothetical protein n=1 Tax=Methyloversatilis sp. TaxID=2569862 RepID=UPI003D2BCFC0